MPALSNPKHERFYVYAVRIDGRTRYVGKGSGGRAATHLRCSHNFTLRAEIDAARALKKSVRVRILKSSLTERDAYRLERRMITKWGDRLANVSMGSLTDLDRLRMTAHANLCTLKTEDQIIAEGDHKGVSTNERLAVRARVIGGLNRIAALAA